MACETSSSIIFATFMRGMVTYRMSSLVLRLACAAKSTPVLFSFHYWKLQWSAVTWKSSVGFSSMVFFEHIYIDFGTVVTDGIRQKVYVEVSRILVNLLHFNFHLFTGITRNAYFSKRGNGFRRRVKPNLHGGILRLWKPIIWKSAGHAAWQQHLYRNTRAKTISWYSWRLEVESVLS